VVQLQRKLAALGYNPGPLDGRFGLGTEEAVYQLQADYHLRRDGIAGRQVAELLGAGFAGALRAMHTVSSEEDLYALAERYGVSLGLLRRLARTGGGRTGRGRLIPGTRLAIPVRPVLAAVEEAAPPRLERLRRLLLQHRCQVTALLVPWFNVAPDGAAEGKIESVLWDLARELSLPLVAQVRVAAPDGLVPIGRPRRQAVAEVARVAARYRLPGLYLAFDPLAHGERYAAATLASSLRQALPASTLLYAEVPAGAPAAGAAELQTVAGLARVDRLVVRLPAPAASPLTPGEPAAEARALLRPFLHRQRSYRLWLGLPAGGPRADLAARLSLVTRLGLSGVVLWDLAAAPEAVFRAMAGLFGVQSPQAWMAGRRNIREPGA
jgi:hypothetical protein